MKLPIVALGSFLLFSIPNQNTFANTGDSAVQASVAATVVPYALPATPAAATAPIAPTVSPSPTPVDVALNLCGPKPEMIDEVAENQKLMKIAAAMPPVRDQKPANWCYAFSATDLVDYNIHQDCVNRGVTASYDDAHLISQIDAVYLDNKLRALNTNIQDQSDPVVDMNSDGGTQLNVLVALQQAGVVRSQKEIPFLSPNENTPAVRAQMTKLVQEYTLTHPSEEKDQLMYGVNFADSEFSDFYTFKLVSGDLDALAEKNGKIDHFGQIQNYSTLASSIGTADLAIPSFVTHDTNLTDEVRFLGLLKNALQANQPVSVGLCGNTLLSPPDDMNNGCEGHAVSLVGAAYVNGVCTVRIKNSWGTDWGDQGYKNLPADQFMDMVRGTGILGADWITLSAQGGTQEIIDDNKTFIGTVKTLDDEYKFIDGTMTYSNGIIFDYKNGVGVDRFPVN